MKGILLVVIFSISVHATFSQVQSSFKVKSKNTGTYVTSFKPVVINGQSCLKSASTNSIMLYRNLGTLPLRLQESRKKIILDQDSITPIFLEVNDTCILKSSNIQSPKEKCFAFLEMVKNELHVANPSECFYITDIRNDELGQQHIRLGQKYKGINVYGSDFYVHLNYQQQILNGRYKIISGPINIVPGITNDKALRIAINDLSKTTVITEFSESFKKLLDYHGPVIDTVIFEDKTNFAKYCLAYHIIIRPNLSDEWYYFVNAANGSIIKKYNNTKQDGPATATAKDLKGVTRTINTYLENGNYVLIDAAEPMYNATKQEGVIATYDALNTPLKNYSEIKSSNNTWNNPTAVSAHFNSYQSYQYFKNTLSRNSINGNGGNIVSFINVSDENGNGMDNAYWNGKFMCYGNGNIYFTPLAGGLDVAAHEMGHGVTQNTANLEYQGQSGAINETFSDIFASMVDRSNWYIGEDITKTSYIATGRLRDMSNPHNGATSIQQAGWQPMHVSEMYSGTQDNGGVHVNSGIGNYAFYLFATAVSKEKAEQTFYKALTTYLTKTSQFIDFRIAVIQAAKDLYGENSNEVTQAKSAFDAVGIYDEQSNTNDSKLPENPGQEYLLTYNTNSIYPNSLYRSTVTGTNFSGLSGTVMKNNVSVVDNGTVAVFVSTDNKIRAINLDPANPNERIISNDVIWENVAVSKDGNRLAAITTETDTAIYLYDFVSQKWAKFKLYNPTTQRDVKSGGVLFADAIEFDITGENLIYDSYNKFQSNFGEELHYWDIGLIHVWDNQTNKFADGTIAKLFSNIPDSVSIGNPTFSKTSPNIIAFDYLKEGTNEYAILGLNLEKMDLGIIASNVIIGYPAFSKSDNKIAYSSLNTSDKEVVAEISLNADKISSSASPSLLVDDAKWPVYYATGTRALGLVPVANFTASYKSGNAPLEVKFTDLSTNKPTSWQWTFESGTPSTSTNQNPSVTYTQPGTYSVTLKAINSYGNNVMTKSGYITVSKSTDLPQGQKMLFVYPNPAKDMLYINNDFSSQNAFVKVYSMDGTLIKFMIYNNNGIDISDVDKGVYLLVVRTAQGNYQTKIIKE